MRDSRGTHAQSDHLGLTRDCAIARSSHSQPCRHPVTENSVSSPAACTVEFQPAGRRVAVPAGSTLLEAGHAAGLVLTANCGGVGVCGRCRVTVARGDLYPPVEAERRVLSDEQLATGERLACRVRIAGDARVDVPRTTLASEQRLQLESGLRNVGPEPAVLGYPVEAPPPSLEDTRSDFERVCAALPAGDWSASPAVLRRLPALARESGWRLTAFGRGRELVGFAARRARPLGVAFDIGTTKIAAYLVELETAEELAAAGAANPQLSYGEDLISRLVYARGNEEHARTLAERVRASMDELIGALVVDANAEREHVVDVCAVGNTAMIHLFLGLPVDQLVRAPFVSVVGTACDVRAHELGLAVAPGAYVHVLPGIGGWVGADHVGVMVACGLDRAEQPTLAVDIGTNTEIAIGVPEGGPLLTTSTPAGPALEGAHIRDGMRAAPGAIERVWAGEGGVELRTIGDLPPVGICGSGIVDAVAQLWRERVLDRRGHVDRNAPGVRVGERGCEVVLVPAARTGHGRDIVVTQQDVSEVQLAKAAISAGIQTLLDVAGLTREEIGELVVAGAFGSFLGLDSAVEIGLLPRLPNARYVQAGNAAGLGARLALVSLTERERARQAARRATRIELKTHPAFDRTLARATQFPVDDPATTT